MGGSIKHYLSDFSLIVMICAVFNQHHQRIRAPLQALCLFLTEYAEYDGRSGAISVQGVVPFLSGISNQPRLSVRYMTRHDST